jgi:hypothetical protein
MTEQQYLEEQEEQSETNAINETEQDHDFPITNNWEDENE